MKRIFTAILLFAAIPVMTANAQQQPQQPPQEITIKLNPTETDIMWKGLRELPVKEVEALMQKIRQQVVEQTTPKPVPAPTPSLKEHPKKE